MAKLILKSIIPLLLLILSVSLHVKLLFVAILYLIWRGQIPEAHRKGTGRWIALSFIALYIFLYPSRKTNGYIASVYFDRQTGETTGQPWLPYLANVVSEGDIMTGIVLVSKILPQEVIQMHPFLSGGAMREIIRYNKRTPFFRNNFHMPYRGLEWRGSPPHHVPFQLLKDRGFYSNLSHYFMHVPKSVDAENAEVIVFCHGYTGNWLLYTRLLAEYTDAIIIAVESPGFSGYFGREVMQEIISTTIPHAFEQLDIAPRKAHLVGLSNGGSAINTVLSTNPGAFGSYTILSARLETTPPQGTKVQVIYGDRDGSGGVNAGIPGSRYTRHVIEGEDHMLIVSRPERVYGLVDDMVGGG